MTQLDKKTDLYVKLLSAIEASKGGITWTDVAVGVQRALERKRQESVAALVNSMPLSDLMITEEIAHREIGFSTKPEKTVEVISANQEKESPAGAKKKRRWGAR